MRCLYCDQRMWICSFHGAYHRDCHFYYFDIVSGFGPRLCSSRWGDICLFEKWQSSAKNAANFRVSTKTCPAYQFFSKSEKQWWFDGTLFFTGKFNFRSLFGFEKLLVILFLEYYFRDAAIPVFLSLNCFPLQKYWSSCTQWWS